jgi:hypothetical protein
MVTILAVLVVGGGTAYAATEMLPKNSVGSKQIKKEAVTPAKLSKAAKKSLIGANGVAGPTGPQGKEGASGSPGVGSTEGAAFVSAGLESLPVTECEGEPASWFSPTGRQVGYYRDSSGFVHLTGWAIYCNPSFELSVRTVYTLPAGFRPTTDQIFPDLNWTMSPPVSSSVEVGPTGAVIARSKGPTLDGIQFRCGPSGQNGCP